MGKMENPCVDCTNKVEDEYGLFCDLACGKHTDYVNYQAGIKEVVESILSIVENPQNRNHIISEIAQYCKSVLDNTTREVV